MEISMTLASRRASEQPSGGGGAGERARKRQRAGEGSDRRRVRESKHAVSRASDQPSGGGGSVRGSQEAAAHAWNPSPLRPPLSAPSSPFSLDVRAAALASPGDALSALLPQRESSPSARDEGGPRPPAAPTSTARNHVFAAFGKGSFAKAATGRSEKDYYATLNIRHDATLQEVNAAYRTLAHKRSRIQWSEGYHCVDIVLQRFQDLRDLGPKVFKFGSPHASAMSIDRYGEELFCQLDGDQGRGEWLSLAPANILLGYVRENLDPAGPALISWLFFLASCCVVVRAHWRPSKCPCRWCQLSTPNSHQPMSSKPHPVMYHQPRPIAEPIHRV